MCAPAIAQRLRSVDDLSIEPMLRSYRADEWPRWYASAGAEPPLLRGPIFDSSVTMASAAARGAGVALLPPAMFGEELRTEQLIQPFAIEVPMGRYWLTRLKSRGVTQAMNAFRNWIVSETELAETTES
jgi:LysR family transcriptional regulator of beta-lactamase